MLIRSEENTNPINLEQLLQDFFKHIERCKIDRSTNKAFLLSSKPNRNVDNSAVVRLHIQPKAGKALENFSVVNYKTNEIQGYKGESHSAVYNHNVLFYIKGMENVFLFHHYGQSGCKTAFLNTFNEFLSNKGLIAHMDVLMSHNMLEDNSNKYDFDKLSLITTYEEMSSDKSSNIGKRKRKQIEQEVIISLNSPRASNIKYWFRNIRTKQPSIEELKKILISDNFTGDFEDAKITLKFGNVKRRVSLSEFTGVIAEYDITDKLDIELDGSVSLDSLYNVSDEYAFQFFE